jgi:enterochelin esterase-like enzyme
MKRSGDDWTISFRVPTSARFEYKLVVDGSWIADPNDPDRIDNGVGSENSVYTGPDYRLVTDEAPPKNPLHRDTLTVGGREIVIFTPDDPNRKPILLYGDGPSYEQRGRIQNVVENLVEEGRIKPVVIVLVPPIDRMKEYGPDWKAYGDYLFGSVLPAVREKTGASDKAQELFMGGSSMGGTISLRLAEEYPDKLAGGIHSQSGAFQWSPMKIKYPDLIKQENLRKLAPTARIWLDWGEFEDGLTTANLEAARVLDRQHRGFGSEVTAEGHNWTAWRHRMVDGLVYLLGPAR